MVEPKGDAAKQLQGPEYEQYLEDTLKRRQMHSDEAGKNVDPEALKNLPGICIGKEMCTSSAPGWATPSTSSRRSAR